LNASRCQQCNPFFARVDGFGLRTLAYY